MPRVIHFKIHADDLERTIRFHRSVFKWAAYCKGMKGNLFVMLQADAGAK